MSIPFLPAAETRTGRIFRHDYLIAALIAIGASGLTFALGLALGWFPNGVNGFEIVAATLNYGATYLSIKQRRFTYALGFVASAFWAIAFYQYGLIASSILSLYLVAQLVYGYFRWGPDGNPRPVHKFQWKYLWAYALATAVTYGGAVAISLAFGGTFAFWDGAILVATIWAQFMLDNKVLGAWYVWTLVNIIGVTLYATSGAPFAAVQQFLFGLANIWGYLAWKKSMEANSDNQPKEDSGLSFTEPVVNEDEGMWRRVDPTDIAERNMKQTAGDSDDVEFHDLVWARELEPGETLFNELSPDAKLHVYHGETIGVYQHGEQIDLLDRKTGESLIKPEVSTETTEIDTQKDES